MSLSLYQIKFHNKLSQEDELLQFKSLTHAILEAAKLSKQDKNTRYELFYNPNDNSKPRLMMAFLNGRNVESH